MISILIPTYNVDVRMLVHDLLTQCRQLNVTFEIIIEDDASPSDYLRNVNGSLAADNDVRYIQNETNVGRARIRNHMAAEAKYPVLLFIDCDAGMKRANFISQYVQYIHSQSSNVRPWVVLGGVGYRDMMMEPEYKLRWKYGVAREQVTAAKRNLNPYKSFTPFNLLITKSTFDICSFDESLNTYGYEDTLFGETLQEYRIPVNHIDNELYHDGIDENEVYLSKVEGAVNNLAKLVKSGKVSAEMNRNFRLLVVYDKCRRMNVEPIVRNVLRINRSIIKMMAVSMSSLKALDLYKLLCLMEALHRS